MASIRERASSNGETTFQVLYRHGGKQPSKTFVDRKSAERFRGLVDLLGPDKAIKQLAEESGPARLTVDDLFERFMEWKANERKVTERTLKEYRRDYDNWIRPTLGHRAAESVDELDVQEWVDKIGGRLDPKTVGDRHMILGSMFKFGSARSRRLVPHNPCLETQLPSKRKKAPHGFSLAQWDAMHAWGMEHEPDADDLLHFIISTSWRFSEASAVTAAAVDDYGDAEFEGITVPLVFVSVLGVHRRDAEDRIVYAEGVAKSEAGVRRVNLLPEAAWMVRRRLVGLKPGDLLFTNKRGNMWRPNNLLRSEFARILKGAGIEKRPGMGPHYLRHSHVGILDRAGVSMAKMQRRLGHEDIQTTLNVYGGTVDNALTVEELVKAQRLLSRGGASGEIIAGEVLSEGAQTILGELED